MEKRFEPGQRIVISGPEDDLHGVVVSVNGPNTVIQLDDLDYTSTITSEQLEQLQLSADEETL